MEGWRNAMNGDEEGLGVDEVDVDGREVLGEGEGNGSSDGIRIRSVRMFGTERRRRYSRRTARAGILYKRSWLRRPCRYGDIGNKSRVLQSHNLSDVVRGRKEAATLVAMMMNAFRPEGEEG